MPEYVTTKELKVAKGTRLTYAIPPQKEAVTYAHAVVDPNGTEPTGWGIEAHWSIPLDQAIAAGLVEEVK